MPKNQFQRTPPVQHNRNVPRHGAPLPVRKQEASKLSLPRQEPTPLPTLEALLAKATKH